MKTTENAVSYRPALAKQESAWVTLQLPDEKKKKKAKQNSAKRKSQKTIRPGPKRNANYFSHTTRLNS